METKTYITIDRAAAGWPSGPWDDEPDKMQWPDPATGLPCLAVRNPYAGNWCGYVGLPPDHPLYGKDYRGLSFEVHGGLTFANKCAPSQDEAKGICHTPAPGEPDHVWWFGFDCAHFGDCSPRDAHTAWDGSGCLPRYCTLAYVQNQCAHLAAQVQAGAE